MTTATLENPTTADPYRSDKPVLEIPLSVAIQSAAAMLTSASKDDVTPVLTAAYFDGAELWASDRYKVARFPLPTKPAKEDDRLELGAAFLIPRAALEWVTKIVAKSLRYKIALATMTQAFSPAFMIEILTYCKKYADRGAPFKITTYGDAGANKMNPALIEGAGASFLLQPNLILR